MNEMGAVQAGPTDGVLINGAWEPGSAGTFEVRNPHSGAVLHNVGIASTDDVGRAVAAARAAQPEWAAVPNVDRAKIMRQIHKLFLERAEPIARMITAEIGKTITDSREEVFEYSTPSWSKAAEEILRHRGLSFPSTQEQTTNKRLVMNHRPLGVVAAITPYNFPTDISSIALAHIIAAGNTVIWKPSEYAAVCCAMLADLMKEAGLPDGVLNLVQGNGEVGNALVEHKGVDGVFFTGSTKTGRGIAEKCALRPHLLELGGDGPFIILDDADIDAAVDGAMNG
ncbi:MAG: aldehyde dehydrogenase, partial [Hyphomicrobiales bacterium]|nr:aldehyde dehydrogenase [Hyphomicrobiales bacterium]